MRYSKKKSEVFFVDLSICRFRFCWHHRSWSTSWTD